MESKRHQRIVARERKQESLTTANEKIQLAEVARVLRLRAVSERKYNCNMFLGKHFYSSKATQTSSD